MRNLTLSCHDVADILEALRRDVRAEAERATTDPEWSEYHRRNARRGVDLLEALNPKAPTASLAPTYPLTADPVELPAPEAAELPTPADEVTP